jgi:uncharacterized membrane protein YkvA (DUF1232 family)
MKISHLLILMRDMDLSPELLAERLGISNMTIRRWMKKSANENFPVIYEKMVWDFVYRMVAEGRLLAGSAFVQKAVKKNQRLYFRAAMKSLGIEKMRGQSLKFSLASIRKDLTEIGARTANRLEVDKNKNKILSFSRWNGEWKKRISTLMEVLSNTRLSRRDKLVAYGALFYLLCPFDLIPDNTPVFGFMDDYVVLGLASAHYVSKYKTIFG